MKITKNFGSEEFDQPARHGFFRERYPEAWVPGRLTPLCAGVLQPFRDDVGLAVKILSGFRSEAYNRAIGGARFSQHVQGRAADIVVPGMSAKAVHARLLDLHREGRIVLGGLGLYPGFVHVDVREGVKLARWEGSRKNA